MNTAEFLTKVLPDQGKYFVGIVTNGDYTQKSYLSITDVSDFVTAVSTAGMDAYYAMSSFGGTNRRKQNNVLLTKSLWLDIDVQKPNNSYSDKQSALTALAKFLSEAGLPKPMIVSSGMGYHIYWVFNEAVSPEEWQPVADALKNLAMSKGLIIDPACTADSARILRPVGTKHMKSGDEVTLLMDAPTIDFTSIKESLTTLIPAAKPKSKLLDSLAIKQDFPKGVAGVIANKCRQIDAARANPEDVSEPLWYGLLGLAAFTTTPEEAAIAWSEGHPDYDQGSTLRKLEQWKQNVSGPPTCAYFKSHNPKGCKDCPFAGKIVTPITLGVEYEEVPVSETAPDQVVHEIPLPRKYKRTSDGMKLIVDGADVDICSFDLYPVGYGKDETLGYEVVRYHWDRPHVGWTELKFRQAMLVPGHREFAATCADQGIVLPSVKQWELFHMLLREYMQELKNRRNLSNLYASMGWKGDHTQFVIGDSLIKKEADGTVVEETSTLSAGTTKLTSAMFSSKGDKEQWKSLTKLLDLKAMPWHSFALSMGFAAPLFDFTGLKGMTVSLYGPTGGGKTLVQYWIQSIYGDPEKLHFAAKYTQNALFSRLAMYANLPMTVDEATMIQDKDVGDFLYWVSQGRDKARLSRSADERDPKTWATPVIVSTNISLQAKLLSSGLDTDAQMARLLEIRVQPHEMFEHDSRAGQMIYQHLTQHHGVVGKEYLKELVSLGPEALTKLINDHKTLFYSKYKAKFSGTERYWEQAVILQDLGASIAHRLGLIGYDYSKGTEWVLIQLGALRKSVVESRSDTFDTLGEYLNEMSDASVVMMATGTNRSVQDQSVRIKNELRVRFELGRPSQSAEFDKGVVYVDQTNFKRWLSTHGVDPRAFLSEMEAEGALIKIPSGRMCLGKDTSHRIPQTRACGFDLTHPRLSSILTDKSEALERAAELKLKVIQGDKHE